jgi:hypothetical protein
MSNEQILVTIASSLLSGIIGVFISFLFYRNLELRKLKYDTARKLFGNRHAIEGKEFSEAINEIMIVYSDSKAVMDALQVMWEIMKTPQNARHAKAPDEALIKLMKAVCKDIGIKYKDLPDSHYLQFFTVPPNA